MKNIIKYSLWAIVTVFALTSCDPQESTDYALGETPTESQLSFTATPSTSNANIIEFANTSEISGVAVWSLGNGSTAKGDASSSKYPMAGTYTVTMTLYTSGGSATISKAITIAKNDFSLLNTPMYNALTGGASNLQGKTWVFDQYNDGHFGVGPAGGDSPSWWSCPAGGKDGSSLYTQEFTFTQVGVKMTWKNNGSVYTNANGAAGLKALGYGNAVLNPTVGDYDVEYQPKASYTFSLNEADKTITLSDGAFFGHFAGTSTYKIITLTDDVMYIKCTSSVESGNGWWYRLVPKEKNVKPVVPLKAIALNDNFESATTTLAFVPQDMGTHTSANYSNPSPTGLNPSSKVYLYEKGSAFYANLSYTVSGYKFDLSKVNKVRMKVFIPSYNNYDDTFATAGDWVTINQLQSQVAVKLQNNGLGGNAYTTQTEIVKANLAKDKWLSLEFDFSTVKDRTDYDKIVIQFGAEGHAAPGIFFFDDFSFSE